MTDLAGFLADLAEASVHRIITMSPSHIPQPGQVFIGCGQYVDAGNGDPAYLVVNWKNAEAQFGRPYSSLSTMLADPPAGWLENWSLWSVRPIGVAATLNQLTLVVESAGPDKVLGVALLLARLAGVDPAEIPASWIAEADLWERTGNADEHWTSWTALQSALAHSRFSVSQQLTPETLAAAWTDSLRFLAKCLQKRLPPRGLAGLYDVPEWQSATNALRQENQVYRDWLSHATVLQLSLPLTGMVGRRLVIDALLFVEDQATGTGKVLYRNDIEHSPMKAGFGLAAHHRPSEIGTGNDITIAIDPRHGVHLGELWQALEARETAAWAAAGKTRPHWKPLRLKHALAAFNPYNQPWYIDKAGTIIGAPAKIVGPSQDPVQAQNGSLLSWAEVCETIWQVFNPLRTVLVRSDLSQKLLSLFEIEARRVFKKRLMIAHWPSDAPITGAAMARSFSSAPIIAQILAGLVSDQRTELGLPALGRLPPQGSWDQLDLGCGMAIVSVDGLFVLNDWRPQILDVEPIQNAFDCGAQLENELDEFEKKIGKLAAAVMRLLARKSGTRRCCFFKHRPRTNWAEVEALIRSAARLSADLARLGAQLSAPPKDSAARQLRRALDARWGIDTRLKAVETELAAIETSLRTLLNLRSARMNRFIGIYGFPIFVAANITGAVAKMAYSLGGGKESSVPNWLEFVSFLGAAGTLLLLVYLVFSREDPLEPPDNQAVDPALAPPDGAQSMTGSTG